MPKPEQWHPIGKSKTKNSMNGLALFCFGLTNRFHVVMPLFRNRSQMRPKCGKSKKVVHETIAECLTDFLPHFDILCDLLLNRCTTTWNLFVLRNKETNYHSFFISKFFSITRKPAFAHFGKHEKKAIWRNLLSIHNEAISLVAMHNKELWLLQKNHAIVKLDSNGFLWN